MIITGTTPVNESTNVGLKTPIVITFDVNINPSTVDKSSVIVATNKNSIITIDSSFPQPVGAFGTDNYFKDGVTAFADGIVSVSTNTITFTPQDLYTASAKYTVTISDTIADVNGNLLGKLLQFSFTTAEIDLAVTETLVSPVVTTKIIGTNISVSNAVQPAFYVVSSSPTKDSFLVSNSNVSITFNSTVDATALAYIKVYSYDLLSDYPPTQLAAGSDYTISAIGAAVNIVLTVTVLTKNKILQFVVDPSFKSQNGNTLGQQYDFSFVTLMDPYYTSTKILRLKAGSVLSQISDLNLALVIYYASNDIKYMTAKFDTAQSYNFFVNMGITDDRKTRIKTNYAVYASLEMVLMNNFSFGLHDFVKKQLGDLNLSISSKAKIELYNRLIDDVKQWRQSFNSFMNFAVSSGTFSRGSNYRNPAIGRMWMNGMQPGLNTQMQVGDRFVKVWDEIIEPFPWNWRIAKHQTPPFVYPPVI